MYADVGRRALQNRRHLVGKLPVSEVRPGIEQHERDVVIGFEATDIPWQIIGGEHRRARRHLEGRAAGAEARCR